MELVLTEICDYLNNYFWEKKISGTFTIENGSINAIGLKNGQYFRIIGSTFNDGIHKYPATTLHDEVFEGAIWALAVPQTVIAIASEITAWQEKYGGVNSAAMSPYTSENFGNYGYSKGGGTSDAGASTAPAWAAVYGGRLNKYRKLRGCRS